VAEDWLAKPPDLTWHVPQDIRDLHGKDETVSMASSDSGVSGKVVDREV